MNIEQSFLEFVERYESDIAPLFKELNEIYFRASVSGNSEDYQKAAELELRISEYHSDKEKFNYLKRVKDDPNLKEKILKRISTLLYNAFARHQYEKELLQQIIGLSNELERKYSVFRAKVDNEEISDNVIDEKLATTTDSSEAEKFWKASKQIGREVANDVIRLAKLRNKAARQLGFENYFQMSLELDELNVNFLIRLFDDLDKRISPTFEKLKAEMDEKLSERFKIAKEDLKPWHYGDRFFQSGPKLFDLDFDSFYEEQNIEKLTRDYYDSISLNIDDLLAKSDLYEKPGKYQHAYCTNIDREGDVRVLCNIKPNHRWMSTMLHEFGHAAYDKYISRKLPWILREPTHIFTTEAIAMLFGRMASNIDFIEHLTGKKIASEMFIAESSKALRSEQLIFSRWVQVIFRFEKAMYENPDANLNSLWNGLVKKYQMLNLPEERDEPDWAAKIHVALYPAYYQNYMLGELLASQLYFYIKDKVLHSTNPYPSFYGEKKTGEYLKNLFFSYGSLLPWNELISTATGEELNAGYYLKQFVI